MADTPIISIRHVTKRYPGVVALDDVSLDIRAGELHAIVGENGAGKSTLMKILAGIVPNFEGEIAIQGTPAQFRGTRDAEQAGIAIVHQELNQVAQLSAAANIFLGRELRRGLGLLDHRAMRKKAGALLAELECHVSPDALVSTLRVGDQQLVEIAKALALRSAVLIMDEPTSALTESEVARLDRVIARLRQRGVTILYISHKMDEVFRLADRITVLRDGRLVETVERAHASPRQITHLMVGREIEGTHFEPRQTGDVVLEVDRLSLAWPGHARGWRLRDIRFKLHRGEILGIAGLMGAGRTELLECLFGAAPLPFAGRVLLEDRVVRFAHPREARQAGIALVTEDRKRLGLFPQLSVGANTTICTLGDATQLGLVRRSRERQMATQTVSELGVKSAGIEAPITSLSGGNQQKTIIGRWLLTRPKVLLLDDPTRGIDVGAKAELYRLMDRLCRKGLGIIVTSSELPELLTVSDRILVLCEGRLTAEFDRTNATEERIVEAATLGAAAEAAK
ncbi:MAG: sugar ABC transporter ATP-binding protein [Pirellulales bacterium]|nr:sugar ABC transporter ATP-binding protein [Pirellulales bacterium]